MISEGKIDWNLGPFVGFVFRRTSFLSHVIKDLCCPKKLFWEPYNNEIFWVFIEKNPNEKVFLEFYLFNMAADLVFCLKSLYKLNNQSLIEA